MKLRRLRLRALYRFAAALRAIARGASALASGAERRAVADNLELLRTRRA